MSDVSNVHHRIFAAQPRSYRNLPLRWAEYGTCYRYEQSGELFGLMPVLTLNDDEKLVAYAKEIHRELRAHEVRAEADFSPDPIKAKIAEAEKAKVHTMLVIGGRDMDAGHVSVRLHSKRPQGAKAKAEVVAEILAAFSERRPCTRPFWKAFRSRFRKPALTLLSHLHSLAPCPAQEHQ